MDWRTGQARVIAALRALGWAPDGTTKSPRDPSLIKGDYRVSFFQDGNTTALVVHREEQKAVALVGPIQQVAWPERLALEVDGARSADVLHRLRGVWRPRILKRPLTTP